MSEFEKARVRREQERLRRAYQNRRSPAQRFVGEVIVIALYAIVAAGVGFVLMLTMESVHSEWAAVPPLGFWVCVNIALAFNVVAAGIDTIRVLGRRR